MKSLKKSPKFKAKFHANRLYVERISRGYSFSLLGKKLGLKASTIHHWEAGNSSPSPANALKLANFFNKDVQFFMGF